jgi:hypothetical protein
MEIIMMGDLKIINDMEMVYVYIKMVNIMKDNGKMIKE